jgi:malonyl-CoA O-methyltransferase
MPHKSNHTDEFSKRAKSYTKHNIIQKKVAKHLISNISLKAKTILDLGAGSGAIYKLIHEDVDKFVAVDLASNLLKIHPKGKNIKIIKANFDDKKLYECLDLVDLTVASSSLQWSSDLPNTLSLISKHTKDIAFAIFCDKTFKTIYDLTLLESFLPSSQFALNELEKLYEFKYEIKDYKLDFKDNISKFRYIKNSGVSGGKKQLSYKNTKKLIKNYPLDYLEFEVLFVWGSVKEG